MSSQPIANGTVVHPNVGCRPATLRWIVILAFVTAVVAFSDPLASVVMLPVHMWRTMVASYLPARVIEPYRLVAERPTHATDSTGGCVQGDEVCIAIARDIEARYGIILKDDTTNWHAWEASLVELTLNDIASAFARVRRFSRAEGQALVKSIWSGATLARMHRTNNPFGNFAWVPPGANGKRVEIPDYADENGWWHDTHWTKHVIAHELAHAWDFRNARWNDWDGGPLSARFMTAVGANRDGCATLILCWGYADTSNRREDPMSAYAGSSPVEDWASTFAQFVEPMPNQELGVVRARFMRTTLIVAQ